ncbi:putative Transmembrane protein, partial [Quillaja saponaria]
KLSRILTCQHFPLITACVLKLPFPPHTVLLPDSFCSRKLNMEQVKSQKLAPWSHFISSQFLKKLTQLLLSVSVFSFLFSQTSFLSVLHSYNFFFSKFLFQLFSHTIDKNCIFLLCNGLLVFLAKYSGLIRSLSGSSLDEFVEDSSQSESFARETKEPILEKEAVEKDVGCVKYYYMKQATENENLEEEQQIQESIVDDPEQGIESSQLIMEEEQEEELGEETGIGDVEEEEEDRASERVFLIDENLQDTEVVEEENGMLSTEELNKKFDEFIRRMKEDLKIEARQQLIMV